MAKQDKEDKKPEAKQVTRKEYVVAYDKNFGAGVVRAGEKVKLSEKAANHNLDKGYIKLK